MLIMDSLEESAIALSSGGAVVPLYAALGTLLMNLQQHAL
jgi:hypothetical protein